MTIAATALMLFTAYEVRAVLELLVLALFVALMLGPVVEFLTRRHVSRWLSILLAYTGLLATTFGFGAIAVPPIVREINAGVHQLPAGVTRLRENRTFRRYDNRYKITQKLEAEARKLPTQLAAVAKELSAVSVGAFSAVAKLITVFALAFFLLRDGPRFADRLYRIRGPDHEARLRGVGMDIYHSVAGYVAGNVAISIVAGLVAYIALSVMGVAFAAPLAVLVGVLDLLPLVGATIAGILVGIVTLFYNFPVDTIAWALTVIIYQQIENHMLSPIIYRRTVDVPGMMVIIAVMVGSTLAGVTGALLAIPLVAAMQIIARDYWSQRTAVDHAPATSSTIGRDVIVQARVRDPVGERQ